MEGHFGYDAEQKKRNEVCIKPMTTKRAEKFRGFAKGTLMSLLMLLKVNIANADSYSEVMFYAPINVSNYKLLMIVVLSIMLSVVCGMMCVGCCWWRFGAATKQTRAVAPAQQITSSRAMPTHEPPVSAGKLLHIWCTPHGEKFHNTQSCSGLRNAKSTRKYEKCLVCG